MIHNSMTLSQLSVKTGFTEKFLSKFITDDLRLFDVFTTSSGTVILSARACNYIIAEIQKLPM